MNTRHRPAAYVRRPYRKLPTANREDQIIIRAGDPSYERQRNVLVACLLRGSQPRRFRLRRGPYANRGRTDGSSCRTRSGSADRFAGPRYAVASQQTVVNMIVSSNSRCVPMTVPLRRRIRNPTEIANELTMATISHHAVTRHQNQRTKYKKACARADLQNDVEAVLRCFERENQGR